MGGNKLRKLCWMKAKSKNDRKENVVLFSNSSTSKIQIQMKNSPKFKANGANATEFV